MTEELVLGIHQAAGRPGDVAGNAQLIVSEIARAAEHGVQLLVFPEGFLTGYYLPGLTAETVPATREALKEIRASAAHHRMGVVLGLAERRRNSCLNSAVVITPDGKLHLRYVKRALFGDWERSTFRPGRKAGIFALNGFRIGILICYDVEFPELVRDLARRGIDLIVVPTSLMSPYENVAEIMVPARAMENQIFIAYANRIGVEGGICYVGRSRVCGPSGEILAAAGADECTTVAARLELRSIAQARATACYLDDLAAMEQRG